MKPALRAAALGSLAVALATLAAQDVARRERALAAGLGPPVPVVVAARPLGAGAALAARDVAVRSVPARYAPAGAAADPAEVLGGRLAVPVSAGAPVSALLLEPDRPVAGVPVRRGERVAELVAAGSADVLAAGTRVDVVVTPDRGGRAGATRVALQDVEVLAAQPAEADARGSGPRVAARLRVTVAQAVALAAAQDSAREIRLLPRAPGDRERVR